jgi:hypothetical protein
MKKLKIPAWLRNQTTDVAIDETLLQQSAIARTAKRLIQASMIVHALSPVLVVIGIIALSAVPALAQSPGGSIFGGNDQTLGNGVREAIKWGRNLLFLLGVGGVMWGAFNVMTEKNWTKQFLGGALCLGFGGIVAIAQSFSQGNAVNLDTTLPN